MPKRIKIINHDHPPRKRKPRVRRLRSIPVLPAMLTLGNMLCGFAAVYFCILGVIDVVTHTDPSVKVTLNNPRFEAFLPTFFSVGGFLILLGLFFDMMDGQAARLTKATTNFGGQLDSLADMVTFGVAPAMLVISLVTAGVRWSATEAIAFSRFGWVAGAVFASCCALRLARFNVEHAKGDLKHMSFHGLPSPGAAIVIASLVILYEHVAEVRGLILLWTLPFVAIATGLLMISRVRYVHLGNTYLRGRRPLGFLVVCLIVVALALRLPAPTLAVLAGAYALSGPAGWIITQARGRGGHKSGRDEPQQESGDHADSAQRLA